MRVVVEVHTAVHEQPVFLEPAQPRGIGHLHQAVDGKRQPRGRPVPEEERVHEQHGDGEREDQHRQSRQAADREARAGEQHERRQREEQHGAEVVAHRQRADVILVLAVREHVIAQDRPADVEAQHGDEAREHGEVLAPHVLRGLERRAVQQLAHALLVVADHRHAGGDRDEEYVEDADQHHQRLGDGELGRDPGTVAAHARVAGADLGMTGGQHEHEEAEQQDLHPEQRPAQVVHQLLTEDFEQARRVHAVTAAAVLRPASCPGSSPVRMSTR